MATKKYKPVTSSLRAKQVLKYEDEITKDIPEKSLLVKTKRSSGRNNLGRITVRRRGGGAKKRYRLVDFKQEKINVPGKIKSIEYDPNRSANIALVQYNDGEKRYILSPNGASVGMEIIAGNEVDIKVGNRLTLANIPSGSVVHNIELTEKKGAQLARAAGAYAVLMAKSDKYATLKLPSGEVRVVNIKCKATLGQVGNLDKRNIVLGKAGTSRHIGCRPKVRGSVMNACDHPHGGGEGRAPIGRSGPMTPWGKPALGYKTRRKKKQTNKYIIKKRK